MRAAAAVAIGKLAPRGEEDVTFRKTPDEVELILGGGFKYFLCSPLFGEDSHFD